MRTHSEVVTQLSRGVSEILIERSIPTALPPALWPGRDERVANAMEISRLCAKVNHDLRHGKGFSIMRLHHEVAHDSHLIKVGFWNLFTCLGEIIPQYATGELMYEVTAAANAPLMSHYSRTNIGGGFHTDGTFLIPTPFYAGLICLQQAKDGGDSILVDGLEIYRELARNHPDLLDRLRQEYCFETCGQIPGIEFQFKRIISEKDSSLHIQYLRAYIIEGHRKAGIPLDAMALRSLDTFDELIEREAFQFIHKLNTGEMLILNNYRILHGRKAFVDDEESHSRRLLIRIYAAGQMNNARNKA